MVEILSQLAGKSRLARPMSEVEDFVSVPTIFRSFNRASCVGGAPLGCTWLIHGPPAAGKTAFTVGLIRSLQLAGGITTFFDIELSAETKRWFGAMGVDGQKCLYYGRTGQAEDKQAITYEEVVEEVDGLLDRFQESKRKGTIPPGTPLLVVLDSISKLAPAGLLKQISKEGGEALRSGVGRTQAQMNAAWLISLGPRIGDDNIIFAIIAHESEQQAATGKPWGAEFKVRGGAALSFEAMMAVRVTFAGLVKDLAADKPTDRVPMVGKRHRVQIMKNKHGPAMQSATIYTSTGGGLAPAGFDGVREILHEAILREIVKGPDPKDMTLGSRFEFGSEKFDLKRCYTEPDRMGPILADIDQELGKMKK